MIRRGDIPALRMPGKWLVEAEAVEAFIAGKTVQGEHEVKEEVLPEMPRKAAPGGRHLDVG
jgi:hypothetical protein